MKNSCWWPWVQLYGLVLSVTFLSTTLHGAAADEFASAQPLDAHIYLTDPNVVPSAAPLEQNETQVYAADPEPYEESRDAFHGFYVGGEVGYTYARAQFSLGGVQVIDDDADAFTGGLFLGYSWQWDQFVLGAELFGLISTSSNEGNFAAGPIFLSGELDRTYGAGLRLRGGITAFDDATLLYALVGGGVAVTKVDFNLVGFGSVDETFPYPILQLGGGVEHALGNGWAVRGEVIHSFYYEVDDPLNIPVSQSYDLDTTTFSIGVVFRPN